MMKTMMMMEVEDEWEKADEDDNWDPDFDEFDVPKSEAKKSAGKKAAKMKKKILR